MSSARTARSEWAARYIREHCFEPANAGRLTIGAEMEFIALDATSRAVAPIFETPHRACTLDVVRAVGVECAWTEQVSDKGVPKFLDARGGSLTFEPGGQLEYASAVHARADDLIAELDAVAAMLKSRAGDAGIDLLSAGVDPCNDADAAPLQLTADRYSRMAEYFATIGADGARMMRQTASVQINIGGVSPIDRWDSANRMAPILIALFANSARYARRDTGSASYRAQTWRGVDPSRTGVFAGADPVADYTAKAMMAPAFLADRDRAAYGELHDARVDEASLAVHLSTLFPEVRPRGYLEFRSIDAVDAQRRGAAIVLVTAAMADREAAQEIANAVAAPTEERLVRAGREGLRDETLRQEASSVVDIASAAARRIGNTVISEALLETFSETLRTAAAVRA